MRWIPASVAAVLLLIGRRMKTMSDIQARLDTDVAALQNEVTALKVGVGAVNSIVIDQGRQIADLKAQIAASPAAPDLSAELAAIEASNADLAAVVATLPQQTATTGIPDSTPAPA